MKKSYSTKAYYNYARKLLESDVSAVGDENYEKVKSPQFNKLLVMASTGGVAALGALVYLKREFFIDSWNGLAKFFQDEGAKANASGFWGNVWAGLKAAIMKAVGWIGGIIQSVSEAVGGSQIGNSGITYRGVACMAILAAAVCAVVYKIYKVVKNKRATTESAVEYKARQSRKLRKIFAESNAMFDSMNILTEDGGISGSATSNWDVENMRAMFKASNDQIAKFEAQKVETLKVVNDQKVQASQLRSALDNYSRQDNPNEEVVVNTRARLSKLEKSIADGNAKIDNLTKKQQQTREATKGAIFNNATVTASVPKSMTMWESVKMWAGNHQFVVIVGVIAIIVAAFVGIKKYLDKRNASKAAATTESTIRTRKSNRRRVYA